MRAYSLIITCLANQIFLFIVNFTHITVVYDTTFFFIRAKWRIKKQLFLLKLLFFHIFYNVNNANVFRDLISNIFSDNSLRWTLRTKKYFSVKFCLNFIGNAFLTKRMTTFWNNSRSFIILIILRVTQRAQWFT